MQKKGFIEAFRKATKKLSSDIKIPKFPLEEIEDYYTYYVQIMKIPESVFWNADICFLDRVIENKESYDGWLSYAIKRNGERKYGKR